MDIKADVLVAIIGLILFVFAKQIGKVTIKEQNESWGFHFGEITLHRLIWVYRIIGILMIVNGIVLIFSSR